MVESLPSKQMTRVRIPTGAFLKMKAKEIYEKLEKDFIKPGLSDEWQGIEEGYGEFLSENFKQRAMGIVCDNADKITKVYTAVFPEDNVMQRILEEKRENVMLFMHHPLIWDIRKSPAVFQPPKREYLEEFKKRNISIYVLHVPLDNYGEYSTSKTLADAIGVKIEKPFASYFGSLAGVICSTNLNFNNLKKKFAEVLGHEVKDYRYGDEIKDRKIAVVGGGGTDLDVLKEMVQLGVNTIATGIVVLNNHSSPAHKFAKEHKINLLGGTHYSTEKFACQAMCNYFKKLGLESEFIPGEPVMKDL